MYDPICMIATLCCYDANLLLHINGGKPVKYAFKPMFQIVCCDSYESVQVFYELFGLLQMLDESVFIDKAVLNFALEGMYPVETIWTIQSYLYRYWVPYQENYKIEGNAFYSTVFWRKIPVLIQSNEFTLSK